MIIWVVKASGNEREWGSVCMCMCGGGVLPNSEEEKKQEEKHQKKITTHIPPDTTMAFHGLTAGQN